MTCPSHIEGTSKIVRDGETLWEKPFLSGEANMSHSLATSSIIISNMRCSVAGRSAVHFFGTATLSFSDGIRTQEGDVFEIAAAPFTLPLANPLKRSEDKPVTVGRL